MISMVVALMTVATSFAQNTLVAVLSHGTDVQMFYGTNAFANAVDAAVSGDVITLSAGTFKAADITKGITIRGKGEYKTILNTSKSQSIRVPEDDANPLVIEGVYFKLYNSPTFNTLSLEGSNQNYRFSKCSFWNVNVSSSASLSAKFVNCDFTSALTLQGSSTLKFANCIVKGFRNPVDGISKAEFNNCVVYPYVDNIYYKYYFNRCNMVNSVIIGMTPTIPADAFISAMNSLFINCSSGGERIDCYTLSNTSTVFATTTGAIPYSLTDEAKTTYIGTDGTEIGIYGGQYPYSLTPTYPLITKLNVAKQATADNKLSVEIEVTAAE